MGGGDGIYTSYPELGKVQINYYLLWIYADVIPQNREPASMLFHLQLKVYKFQGGKKIQIMNQATYLLSQCLLMAHHMTYDL
jgi:hypothetical protein